MSPQAGQPRTVRPRYLRITAAGFSALVTLVAVLGAVGVLPVDGSAQPAYAGTMRNQSAQPAQSGAVSDADGWGLTRLPIDLPPGLLSPAAAAAADRAAAQAAEPGVPAGSGEGRRIVFDRDDQRVWLVSASDAVRRTYLVSGSLTDNLAAGTYEVYSKSRDAVGIDGSTMRHMVRFTQGVNAAIGFHDIPVEGGEKVQGRAELGSPQSHGCIRQMPGDARALWRFAPLGTTVVVL